MSNVETDQSVKPLDREPFECKTCGTLIGMDQPEKTGFMCSRVAGEWCPKCFRNKPCIIKPHPVGCATRIDCS